MKKEIKEPPANFIGKGEVRGFQFKQIRIGAKACIYEVQTGYSAHYEVFKIQTIRYPKSEQLYHPYPKANSFSIWAWTYKSFEVAFCKFRELEENEKRSNK